MLIQTFHDRALWLAARRRGVGGSDVPAILGVSPWTTPLQVWAEKVGIASADGDSYTLRRGSHMEALLAGELARAVELTRDDGSLVCSVEDHGGEFPLVVGAEPWMRYSPDGFLNATDKRADPPPTARALVEYKSHPRGASEWTEGAPPHVVAQVQWGLHVCDLPACYVAVDLGTEFRWCRVERDAAWWPANEAALREFWRRVVEEDAPPPTADEGDKRALGAMYRRATDEVRALPAEMLEDAQTIAECEETIKACETRKAEIENRVRAAIGDAGRGMLPDGSGWSWTAQSRPKMVPDPTAPRIEFRVLRRFGAKKESAR